jgi:hypothetical protein
MNQKSPNASRLLIHYMDNDWGRGFLAEMQCVVIAYSYAVELGMDFYLDDTKAPLYFTLGFEHYFDMSWQASKNLEAYEEILTSGGPKNYDLSFISNIGVWDMFGYLEKNVSRLKRRNYLHKIFTLQPHIQSLVEKRYGKSGIKGEYACAHIRRGDAIEEATRTGNRHEVSEYIQALQTRNPGLDKVYVCTDDYSVVDEVKEYIKAEGFNWSAHTLVRPQASGFDFQGLKAVDARFSESDVVDLLTDLAIAARSELFAGTHSSNFFKVMKNLHKYQHACLSVGW